MPCSGDPPSPHTPLADEVIMSFWPEDLGGSCPAAANPSPPPSPPATPRRLPATAATSPRSPRTLPVLASVPEAPGTGHRRGDAEPDEAPSASSPAQRLGREPDQAPAHPHPLWRRLSGVRMDVDAERAEEQEGEAGGLADTLKGIVSRTMPCPRYVRFHEAHVQRYLSRLKAFPPRCAHGAHGGSEHLF